MNREPLAWIGVVAAYALAAWACAAAWQRGRGRGWMLMGIIVLGLGAMRGLDGWDWLTAIGRRWASRGGWYDQRQAVQAKALLGLAAIAFIAAAIAWWNWTRLTRYRWAWVGVGILIGVAGVRVVSMHAVDHILSAGLGPVRLGRLIELAALAAIACEAHWEIPLPTVSPIARDQSPIHHS